MPQVMIRIDADMDAELRRAYAQIPEPRPTLKSYVQWLLRAGMGVGAATGDKPRKDTP